MSWESRMSAALKAANAAADSSLPSGTIASARLVLAGQPNALDTVTIGGMVFEAAAASPPVPSAASKIAYYRGANLAAALANLIKAANGTVDAANVTYNTDGAIPPAVLGDAYGGAGGFRIKRATAPGGTAIVGPSGSLALSTNVGGSAWDMTNLNAGGGTAGGKAGEADGSLAITAAMVTKGFVEVELPFAAARLTAQVWSSTGVLRSQTDAFTLVNSGNSIHIALAGGASPNIQATDIVTFRATA